MVILGFTVGCTAASPLTSFSHFNRFDSPNLGRTSLRRLHLSGFEDDPGTGTAREASNNVHVEFRGSK